MPPSFRKTGYVLTTGTGYGLAQWRGTIDHTNLYGLGLITKIEERRLVTVDSDEVIAY